MKLQIIIPNYNGKRFLSDCLDSLRSQTEPDFSVTVVDNGSSDGSVAFLRQRYPEVRLIKFPCNRGFSAAANAGIRSAESPYVMLLNNDTILAKNCIELLLKTIRISPDIFSVSACVLNAKHPDIIDTAGDFYSIFGYAFCRDQGFPYARDSRPAASGSCLPVFSCCGCAVVYRKALLEQTGLFDENFFAYLEDVDLGFRARLLGLRNCLCRDALVFHHGSGTTGAKYTPFKVYHSARNNLLLRKKNLSLLQRLFHSPFFLSGSLLKYLYFHRRKLGSCYRRGWLEGMLQPSATQKSRHSLRFQFLTELWIWYGTVLYLKWFLRRRYFFKAKSWRSRARFGL